MSKSRLLIIAAAALFLSACFNNSAKKPVANITTDTLKYAYQVVNEQAANCGNKPDTACATAKIKYPEFTNQDALNDTLKLSIIKLFDGDPDNSLQTMAKNFITSFEAWKKVKKTAKQVFKLNLSAKVLRQDSSLAVVQIDGSSFAGNKHPIALTKFTNWNTRAQKPIILDSLFTNPGKQQLTAIAEKIFRKQENLKDTSSLARDYFFKGNQFSLTHNFAITPIGIRFFYNLYEIKPYNAGTTDLFIPYSSIKQLLRPNTVISQYIK
ncbi:uncharacterized protein DUF3298 [Mucilaginibacter gracilis]|uniref:Uncharacterized protein DUF3298 n=1 Tax=Mucilaginibacter gracilis TaxID=423350 RepID=A0A495J955_9SPHI|nr:RsiV family protein [Mucilaginibacter gracilis]RKR85540.1 uncharacterized protein DUF3298 [Mucilaginibacter gracilis]